MTSPLISNCEWCGADFERAHTRGPLPKFCSNAHRQAAHRARRRDALDDSSAAALRPIDLGALVLRHRAGIVAIAAHRNATNVRLFGSVARGDATADSDIDLLVDLDDSVSLVGLAGLERELRDLLGRHVDVVPTAQLKSGLRAIVDAEAIPL